MRPAQAETVVDVTEVIERTGLGGFQLRAFSVVAACLVMDGFDLQAMGYAAPALLQDWKLAPATMGAVFSAGLLGLFLGALATDLVGVCGDELALFNQVLPEFKKYSAELLGISVDSTWSHIAFAESRNLHFPLLSDYNPKGKVATRYGVYLPEDGEAARALFVMDGRGVIRWSYLSPIGVSPGADGILNAHEDLQKSGALPKSIR